MIYVIILVTIFSFLVLLPWTAWTVVKAAKIANQDAKRRRRERKTNRPWWLR